MKATEQAKENEKRMTSELTMGALFSGSGGFELAGSMCGIKPVWASEIEPLPILVTATRFPVMEHFGDIKKMDGKVVPKVDIITGGSPCQDMSIAGKREGLGGSRSNLFREQIRIVKEMRESDKAAGRTGKQTRPRFMVWENVPGAFSSNNGKDFRSVLEEIAKIKDSSVSIPMPEKNKWNTAGCIMGDDYSIAWRVLDAQYFGVPQRRKRIYLVADFGGDTAPEILFEQDSLRGNPEESCKERKGTANSAGNNTKGTDREIRCFDIGDRRKVADQSEVSPTLTQKMGTGGNNVPIVMETRAFHLTQDPISMEISPCMTQGNPRAGQATIGVVILIADKATRHQGGGNTRNDDGASNGIGVGDEKAPSYTLTSADKHSVAYVIDRAAFNQGVNAKYDIGITKDIARTIVARGPSAVAHKTYAMQGFGEYKISDTVSSIKQRDFKDATDLVVAFEPGTVPRVGGHYYENGTTDIVRRLTPTECGRLQGFPDGWADNLGIDNPTEDDILFWQMIFKEHSEALGIRKKEKTDNQIRKWLKNPESDSAKYKMWGNGIALPCAMMVMGNIVKVMKYERDNDKN